MLAILAVLVMGAMLVWHLRAQETALKPDPAIQLQVRRVLNLQRGDDFFKELEALEKSAGRKHERLVPQLLYYSVYGTDAKGQHDLKEAMAFDRLVDHLDISPTAIAVALVPYLEIADPKLHEAVREAFREIGYSHFQALVEGAVAQGAPPPTSLVRYMYERNPGQALLTLARTSLLPWNREGWKEKRRSLLWAEHVVSDVLWKHEHEFLDKRKVEPQASAELERLAKDDAWWVRLYVAEIMRQHPAFRTPELVSRLKDDPHTLVREAMDFARVKAKEAPKTPPGAVPPAAEPRPTSFKIFGNTRAWASASIP